MNYKKQKDKWIDDNGKEFKGHVSRDLQVGDTFEAHGKIEKVLQRIVHDDGAIVIVHQTQ